MGIFTTISSLVSGIFEPAAKLVDDLHTSKEEKLTLRNKLVEMENALTTKLVESIEKVLEAQKAIIMAEMQGSWLQKNWRPLLMLMIMAILMNNLILVPYMNAIFNWSVVVGAGMDSVPVQLWNLLTAGVGGYVGGRTIEKVVKTIKGKK